MTGITLLFLMKEKNVINIFHLTSDLLEIILIFSV